MQKYKVYIYSVHANALYLLIFFELNLCPFVCFIAIHGHLPSFSGSLRSVFVLGDIVKAMKLII